MWRAAQWHIWVEDSANEHVYHAETWLLTKKMMRERAHRLSFTIPIFEPLPSQYYIRCARMLSLPWEGLLAHSLFCWLRKAPKAQVLLRQRLLLCAAPLLHYAPDILLHARLQSVLHAQGCTGQLVYLLP